jgi:signal transduction histidine kinase
VRELAPEIGARHDDVHRGFFEATGEAFLVLDENLLISQVNAAATRLLGEAGLRLGGRFEGMFEFPGRPSIERMFEQVRLGRVGAASATIAAAGSRNAIPVDISASPFVVSHRQLVAVVVRDRTAAVEAARRLRDREEQYRTLFMRAPVALREEDFSEVGHWMADLRSRGVTSIQAHLDENPRELEEVIAAVRTVRVNPACVELLKAESENQVLSGFRRTELTAGVRESLRSQVLALWRGETSHETEFEGLNFAGEPFACRLHWTVQHVDGKPDLSRVVVGLLDVTAVLAAQRRLEGLIADKDRFLASVSHELRTPLAAVFGLSSELYDRWPEFGEEERRSLVEIVVSQSGDLTALVEDLLLSAKLEMGDVRIDAEDLDLLSVAKGAVEDVEHSDAPPRAVAVIGTSTPAHADAARVRQIVRNLLTNAARYGGPSVSVTVSNGPWATVEVSDDGPGIPPDEWGSIFDPYHRAVKGDSVGSLGLGLTISRELARAMGGNLDYCYEDGRSVFTLTLPRG